MRGPGVSSAESLGKKASDRLPSRVNEVSDTPTGRVRHGDKNQGQPASLSPLITQRRRVSLHVDFGRFARKKSTWQLIPLRVSSTHSHRHSAHAGIVLYDTLGRPSANKMESGFGLLLHLTIWMPLCKKRSGRLYSLCSSHQIGQNWSCSATWNARGAFVVQLAGRNRLFASARNADPPSRAVGHHFVPGEHFGEREDGELRKVRELWHWKKLRELCKSAPVTNLLPDTPE